MWSLYIDLNDLVTQETETLIGNIKSDVPVIRPVVSTTSDPLLQFDSNDETDDEENNGVTCPLHVGGYKFFDYDSNDEHIRKKCKISNRY